MNITYPVNRETKAHDLPTSPVAADLWYNKTSYWASSNCKHENVTERKNGQDEHP